jgi:hypothetical protein
MTILLVASCASDEEGLAPEALLSQAPVVNQAPPSAETGVMAEEVALERLASAREAFLREDYDLCLRITKETLEEGAPHEIAAELRALRFEARRLHLSRAVVSARIIGQFDVYPLGEPIVLSVVLRNVSNEAVTVVRSGEGVSDSVIVIDAERIDYDIYGNVRSETGRLQVPLPHDLEIPVAGRAEVPFTVESGDVRRRHYGFSLLRLAGTLRPAVILRGESEFYSGVTVEPGEVRILPPGFEPIAADPIGTIGKAYELGAREHLFLAVELSPPERRDQVTGELMKLLENAPPPMAETIMAALQRITGRSFDRQPELWREWWRKQSGG